MKCIVVCATALWKLGSESCKDLRRHDSRSEGDMPVQAGSPDVEKRVSQSQRTGINMINSVPLLPVIVSSMLGALVVARNT